MEPLGRTLLFVIDIAWFVVIAQAVLSWLVAFEVLNLRQPFVYQLWSGLNKLTEPLYRPIRNLLPDMGGIDISPLVVLVGLYFLGQVVVTYMLGAPGLAMG